MSSSSSASSGSGSSSSSSDADKIKAAEIRALARRASAKNQETAGTLADAGGDGKKKAAAAPKLAGWKHAIAGAVAGCCEVLGTMPLDVAKTNMQMNPGKYSGPVDCLTKIYRTGGFPALYYGTTPFMLQTAGKAAIRFSAFAKIKDVLELVMGEGHGAQINLWSGLLAGAVEAAVWTTPTERIKVLRQTEIGSGNRYGNIFSATKYIVQTQGISGMFVGLVPTTIRQASSVGVRMALYPFVKQAFPENGGTLTHMASGGIVGGLSVVLNNPVDVCKSMMQAGKLNAQGQKMGMMESARVIVKESGFAGFGRGLTARVPRVFCGQAITFATYEQMAAILAKL